MSAAIEVYIDPQYTGNPIQLSNAFNSTGVAKHALYATWAKGTESDGTIYRIFKGLSGNIVPLQIGIYTSGIAGFTSAKLGLLNVGLQKGVVTAGSDACFMAAGQSLAAATVTWGTPINGLTALSALLIQQTLFAYAGNTILNRQGAYDLALTGVTAGTATGNLAVYMEYVLA